MDGRRAGRAKMNESPRRTRPNAVIAWILYDVAMHGYSLMIPGVAYAIYFTSFVAGDSTHADVLWSVAVSLSLVIAGLLAPWVGAAVDETGRRRSRLGAATLLCGVASALLVIVGRGDVFAGIVLFVLAQVGSIIGSSLYNSYLPMLATPRRAARLSGLAWGLSYLGGIGCFLLCLPFIRDGIAGTNGGRFAYAFVVTGAFLLLIGLPAIAAFPATTRESPRGEATGTYRRLWSTVKRWRHDREVPKLLLAYYLVNDAIVTVIFFTAVMMKSAFGLDVQEVLVLSLLFQAIAVPATMFFGWLGGRWSQRGAIYVTLALWMVTLALLASAQGRLGAQTIAVSLGLVLGSTQTLFRSLLASMVPDDRASEYYGFHAFMGRASSALGPLFFGAVSTVTGSQRLAMASLAVFFIAGGIVLARVRLPAHRESLLAATEG
jgi:UMF1 family MFS transporter